MVRRLGFDPPGPRSWPRSPGWSGFCVAMMVLPALLAGAAIGAGLSLLTGSALWFVDAVAIAPVAYVASRYGQHRAQLAARAGRWGWPSIAFRDGTREHGGAMREPEPGA